jgi:hypothetical protein
MGLRSDTDARQRVDVACPHPDCGRPTAVEAPEAGTEVRVSRRSSPFDEYETVRCPAGHDVYVYYCRST